MKSSHSFIMKSICSIFLIVAFILSLSLVPTTGYALDERDGAWWVEQDTTTRASYLDGIIDGIQLGRDLSLWEIKNRKEEKTITKGSDDTFKKNYAWYLGRITREQLLTGLNTLYEDKQNLGLPVYISVWYAARNVVGVPEGEIDPFMMAGQVNKK